MLRVRELLKRELARDIQREYNFQEVLVSIHEVEVTPDLRDAKVFIGVIGPDHKAQSVVDRLNRDRGALQKQIARRVVLRNTPRLEFRLDDSVARGVEIVDLLDSIDIPDDVMNDPEAGDPGAGRDGSAKK